MTYDGGNCRNIIDFILARVYLLGWHGRSQISEKQNLHAKFISKCEGIEFVSNRHGVGWRHGVLLIRLLWGN